MPHSDNGAVPISPAGVAFEYTGSPRDRAKREVDDRESGGLMNKGCAKWLCPSAGSLSDDAPLIETLDRLPAADVSERVSLRYMFLPLSAQKGLGQSPGVFNTLLDYGGRGR